MFFVSFRSLGLNVIFTFCFLCWFQKIFSADRDKLSKLNRCLVEKNNFCNNGKATRKKKNLIEHLASPVHKLAVGIRGARDGKTTGPSPLVLPLFIGVLI